MKKTMEDGQPLYMKAREVTKTYIKRRKAIDTKPKRPKTKYSKINLKGKVFGELTVIKLLERPKRCTSRWLCLCSCGKEIRALAFSLVQGSRVKCGNAHNVKSLVDSRFGRLVVIKQIGKNKQYRDMFLCSCDCGNSKELSRNTLLYNKQISCGCARSGPRQNLNNDPSTPRPGRPKKGETRNENQRNIVYGKKLRKQGEGLKLNGKGRSLLI